MTSDSKLFFKSLIAFCIKMQATTAASAEVDASLLKLIDMPRADFLCAMGVLRGITRWLYNGEPELLLRYIKQASWHAMNFLTCLLAVQKKQRLYYLTADTDILQGELSVGAITIRARRNSLMNWAYRKDACLRFGRKQFGRGEKFTVIQVLTPCFIFFTNREEIRNSIGALINEIDLTPDYLCCNSRALLGKLMYHLRELYVAMQEYSDECEVLTYGEHRAPCRVTVIRQGCANID